MTRKVDYKRYRQRPSWPAVVETYHHERLACGHEVEALPVATLGDRKYYICPQDCGIQKAITTKKGRWPT